MLVKKITYKPLFGWVLIKPEPDTEMIGRIYVPDVAQKTLRRDVGTVEAVGPGYTSDTGVFIKTTVKPGMKVFYSADRTFTVKGLGTQRFVIVREADLISDLKEEEIEVKE